jgi:antitoxin VapB
MKDRALDARISSTILRISQEEVVASLYIKDAEANALAEQLATKRGLTKTAAVKLALENELSRDRPSQLTAREKLLKFWEENPLPPPTGLKADKAFFDDLWGEE